MKILSVEFLSSMVDPMAEFPSPLPQIAFTGRSNAGKSSLINTLLQRTRKKIAHVSSRPGKTQALNFFEVNRSFLLVDLPGFGYAKAPAEIRDGWKALTRRYIARPDGPAGIVHLLDIRRDPGEADADHLDFLAETGKPVLIVLTKVDKLNRKGRLDRSAVIRNRFALDEEQTILFSSVTGEGREELSDALLLLLEESAEIGEAGDTRGNPASEEIGEAEERSVDA